MATDQSVYMTQEGLDKVKEELVYLQTIKREEISEKLEKAIAQGDLKENADYHAAKEEQGFTEGRVQDIEDILRRVQIIKNPGPSSVVRVGSKVAVCEVGFEDEEETYYIVGAREADPSNGRISNESPIGSALVGAKKGAVVSVKTPGGELKFKIKSIS